MFFCKYTLTYFTYILQYVGKINYYKKYEKKLLLLEEEKSKNVEVFQAKIQEKENEIEELRLKTKWKGTGFEEELETFMKQHNFNKIKDCKFKAPNTFPYRIGLILT